MRLYEFEGKKLLASAGFAVPVAQIISSNSLVDVSKLSFPIFAKVQVLGGNRAQRSGVVRFEKGQEQEAKKTIHEWLNNGWNGEKIEYLLIEQAIQNIKKEHYFALRWDTTTRGPVVLYSAHGGSGIEQRQKREKAKSEQTLETYRIDMRLVDHSLQEIAKKIFAHNTHGNDILKKLWQTFYTNDATLVEINPLFELTDETFVAGDAKIDLDDLAAFRHPEWESYPKRTAFARLPTAMEEEAKNINAMDHRGVAGASFFEFDGDIGIMASGGGASLLVMDALMASGLKPANYTEYSGNPSREKVAALTTLVVSKPGLKGLLVIGGNANFTDIFETLAGVMDGLESAKPKVEFPIVVRRGGPRWQEAFEMVRKRAIQNQLHVTLFGPETSMLEAVPALVKKVGLNTDTKHKK
ncbi:MAG: ATP citrate lyase citrate-binding domain-containing protein [Patescibacteria group bacterium]|mgnify:CR=1 FL=1